MTGPKSRPPRWVEKLYEVDEPLFEPVLAAGVLVETRPLTGTRASMRPIWSGTISFGLVSVPARMFPATASKELRFHFLHRKDLTPIAYEKVRRDDRQPVEPDDIVRGFEIEKGRYVPLEDDDLDRLDIELTHSIDICDFVDLDEIDPVYFRKAYYLLPAEGAEKPYRLLVRALDETGKVGIAKVVIRNKQHLAVLRPYEDVLLLETMYYADEVRRPEQLDGDLGKPKLQKAEVELAKSLVENLSEPFKAEKYDDTYRKELLDLIKAKAEGQPLPEQPDEEEGEVVDLMSALRESVERTKKKRRSTSKRKAS
jgi:DNA end-binding protein Ku